MIKKKHVLFLSMGLYPLNSGLSLYSYGICEELSKSVELTVFSILENTQRVREAYEKIGSSLRLHLYAYKDKERSLGAKLINLSLKVEAIFRYVYPLVREFYKGITEYLDQNKVDTIIIDHVAMAMYFRALHRRYPEITFIYNSHNVEFLNNKANYYDRRVFQNSIGGRVRKAVTACRCRLHKRLERMLLNKCSYTFCISKCDAEILGKEFGNGDKLRCLKPLIHFPRVKNKESMDQTNKKLLIIGSMSWFPNYNGIVWFVEKVFGKLLEIDPEYELYLVGRDPDPHLAELVQRYPDNIILTGGVPDTEEYFKLCSISIIPIFEGTGAKIKVLESIARGIPTVCSAFAAKDYDITDEIFVADSEQKFLEGILTISNQPELRNKYYDRMARYYDRYFHINQEILDILHPNAS